MLISKQNKNFSLRYIRDNFQIYSIVVLFIIYLSSLMVLTAITQMAFSDKFKASWLFYTTPITKPGEILSGSYKALIFQFYILLIVVMAFIFIALLGLQVIPIILLGIINQLVIFYVIILVGFKSLPFSQSSSNAQKGGQFIKSLFMMLIGGVIGIIHSLIVNNYWAVGAMFVVSTTAIYF